jgi:hypothetical protein
MLSDDIWEIDVLDNPKVFCIGLERTGTKSLAAALAALGYTVSGQSPVYRPNRIARLYKSRCIDRSYSHGAFFGNPWQLVYWEMHQLWPNAKFILTTRDADPWLQSMKDAFGSVTDPVRRFIYDGDILGNEASYLARKRQHEEDVHEYFASYPGTFLRMNVVKGDGYDVLCDFLNKPTPADSFPHEGKSSSMKNI